MNQSMTEKQLEIHTHEVDLRVLGTKFNFKNYSDDEEVTVNLLEGKVALHNGLKSMPELYLAPNEKMVLNKRTGEMIKSKGMRKTPYCGQTMSCSSTRNYWKTLPRN